MKYNFDKVIDRSGTSAEKVEGLKHIWGRTDLIPLWVADMDFATAPFVTDAIRKRCENEVLGYTGKPDSYYNAIINWVKQRYDLIVTKEVINFVPGIVPGIGMAMNCFTQKGDKVMIQPPVYHPFAWVTTRNERTLVINPLKWENGMYRMDLDAFREQIKGCKLFILCNPHNPGGVVWTEAELRAIADICYDEKVLVFSDEIHADLTLPPHTHRPFATVSEKARMNSVTFMSPSKAFLSVEAAYSHGTEWLDQCLAYIQGNIDFVDEFLKKHAPKIKAIRPEASYLVWLDCRELELSQKDLNEFFVDKAHLALNDGEMFGKEGIGFMRLNVASPRCIIEKAMKQLADAYQLYIK